MLKKLTILLVICLFTIAACGGDEDAGKDPDELLPDLDNYRTLEGDSVVGALETIGVTLLELDPEAAAMLSGVEQFYQCAKDVGVAEYRLYSNKQFPESAGVALVINRDRLTGSRFLFDCAFSQANGTGLRPEIQPCSDVWEYKDEEATYWLLYSGTTAQICTDFTNNMPRNEG